MSNDTRTQEIDRLINESRKLTREYGQIVDQKAPWTEADKNRMNELATQSLTISRRIRQLFEGIAAPKA
ncbi:hypothetical protein [Corynebacterium massiliense]|uniref:Uncharacterized protein n=1 Tax=Corynebacterium massiliense DSM 45435 TaxID=1121364 RepID=A0ABY7U6U2_9CORY|nr:hypothetical protein [Corynebacterium massiliense]WCZ32421.1 hypothetical protein CMASS_04870 [Corynebacterium massiliense DSM 45435]